MEKINIDTKTLTRTNEIELRQDVIVPDSKQDIFQIKDQNFYCYFSKIEISNGRIKFSGNVNSYVSYLSSGEVTSALQTTINFEDILEDSSILDNSNVKYDIEISKQEVKIINERKIALSITLKITYVVYGINTIQILDDFSDIEDVEANSRHNKYKFFSWIKRGSCKF